MLNGSVNVLSWLYAMYALPTRGNYELWAPLLRSVVRGLFRRQQYRGLIAGKWCCLICSRGGVLFGFALTSPASHTACRSTFGLGSKARQIGRASCRERV